MRIEIVVEVPNHNTVEGFDVIGIANDVARQVTNQLNGATCYVVHGAVGDNSDIVVPDDFTDRTAPEQSNRRRGA